MQFYRQKQIGKYVVDFYCPKKKLVIEIDGGQHYENGDLVREDKARDNYLEKVMKLKVLRFTNTEIMGNIFSVVDEIERNV